MPSLVSLAEDLLAQAKQVEQVLKQNNIPDTSFDQDTLESLPEDAQKLRWDLLDATHNFRQLLRGARLNGLDIAFNWTEQVILRIIWRYKLASAVPLHGSATYREIADTSGLSEPLVFRTIRAAIPLNIFDELASGQVCHTATSRLLATDEGYYCSVGLQLEDIGPASLKLIEAWETFGDDSGEPNRSAFSLNNNGRSLFTVLAEEPERAHRFDETMKYSVRDKDMNLFDIVKAFDWSSLDKPGSHLVDLGGGYGQISQTLAQHTQHLSFIVQDLPHVAEKGRKDLPPQFSDRITFDAHNFMHPQTPTEEGGPPVSYLISRCLHNWSDHHCSQILRSLVPALKPGSRVLIWDSVIEDSPVRALSKRFNLQQDFIMATISNGKDRSEAEFRRVLGISDARFGVRSVRRPGGSNLSMIEVGWDE